MPTPQLFVSAHTTQFVAIGWRYLPVGSGSGLLKSAGSYVSLVHPTDPSTLTVVIEKMSWEGSESAWQTLGKYETKPETLTLQLGAAFAHRKLALWKSVLHADEPSIDAMLIKQPEVTADATGTVSLAVCVDCLFTLTTQLEAGVKGVVPAAPKPAPSPLPYSDDFDSVPAGLEAKFFIDQAGVRKPHPRSILPLWSQSL